MRICGVLLWRASLRHAFPGGRAIAKMAGQRFTRTWTLVVVKDVHALGNRAAHHEPLLDGLPLPGAQRRITTAGLTSYVRLASLIDGDIAT